MPEYIANHLWQSTFFAAATALLTLTLRRNRAHARHWLWMIASLKFFVPFALVAIIGSRVTPAIAPSLAVSNAVTAVESFGEPFAAPDFGGPAPTSPSAIPIASLLYVVWACGFLAVSISWGRRWIRIKSAVHSASPLALDIGIRASSSPASIEPGVFGIWRPVLVLPEGIADRFTPQQLQSIVAHELCHVRRRDNLAAAIHMAVEAIFWFHPLVWWIGARLIEERERACDEEVIRLGNDPETYAASILRACRFYLESPLACVSGVTGANLKKRIEDIMKSRPKPPLNPCSKLLLAAGGIAAIIGPIAMGIVSPRASRAQQRTFEVASIKPHPPTTGPMQVQMAADRGTLTYRNVTLKTCIRAAYGVPTSQIYGGASWVASDRFDIIAKANGEASKEDMMPMLQAVLAERFKLAIHRENKELPIYLLVKTKEGFKLHPVEDDGEAMLDGDDAHPIVARHAPIRLLAGALSRMQEVGRPVQDRTAIDGVYDFNLVFSPQGTPGAEEPSIFTALQEQLGLKLEPAKANFDVVIIDRAEKPGQN